MLIKGIIDEDFVNYKVPSMTINTNECEFKCDKEAGARCCQNGELAMAESISMPIDDMIERYIENDITKAICFAGLEPFDQFPDLYCFVARFREMYHRDDEIVIYTGYKEEEIWPLVSVLGVYKNIIVKFGRYIPGQEKHFDNVLGVNLASPNQYAKRIS